MIECPRCHYKNKDDALSCNLCGEVIRKASVSSPSPDGARKGGERLTYLTCFPYRPVRLMRNAVCSIGRDKTSDIVLPASVVSRKHAEVRWEGAAWMVKDLKSSNGTFVNDAQVEEGPLKAGDRIKIGTFLIQCIEITADDLSRLSAAGSPEDEKTVTLDLQSVKGQEAGFSGNLADISLPQVLQVLDLERKTGLLLVRVEAGEGRVFFAEGRPVHAETGKARAEEALYEMLKASKGSFRFEGGRTAPERSVRATLQGMLLESSRRVDETAKDVK